MLQRLWSALYKPPAGPWEGPFLIAVGGLLVYLWSAFPIEPADYRAFLLIAAASLALRGAGELLYSWSRLATVFFRLTTLAGFGLAFVAATISGYARQGAGGVVEVLAVLLVVFVVIALICRVFPSGDRRRGF